MDAETQVATEAAGRGADRPVRTPGGFDPIAVIGMSCMASGVKSPAELWETAVTGRRSFTDVADDWWPGARVGRPGLARASVVPGALEFDARLFGVSPRMAVWMDPQHRVALELVWQALEDAGLDPERTRDTDVAVFAGGFVSDYRDRMVAEGVADAAAFPGTLMAFSANRISYQFDWTGPSMLVDTACSSSLTAVDLAVRGLSAGEYSMSVVVAASVTSPGFYADNAERARALSASGECVPFSAERDGYVRGDGGACVILKPLRTALADGDPVHAVIRAAGSGHSGRAGGLTGPDSSSIARLMLRVAAAAGRSVEEIGLVEAHGSGTQAGDLAEVSAIVETLERSVGPVDDGAPKNPRTWVGSVKANIGHLEGAAGLIGLVKAVLAVKEGLVPRVAGLDVADPRLPTASGRVGVPVRNEPWPAGSRRLAAVNSFGLGGAMSSVLVEQAIESAGHDARVPDIGRVVPLSARSEHGLRELADRLLRHLEREPGTDLARLAWTMQSGRKSWPVRRVLIATDIAELRRELGRLTDGETQAAASSSAGGSSTAACRPDADVRKAIGCWLAEEPVDWRDLWGTAALPSRVNLPGAPFERKPYDFSRRRA